MNFKDEQISGRQLALLLFCILISTTILILPALVVREAKQDAWMSILVVTIFGDLKRASPGPVRLSLSR